MERKSAWSLPMSEQEIVNEYKAAKKPQNQIAILAELNGCEKKTIVNILEAAGCELPGNYKKKKKVLLEEEPEEPYKPPFIIKEAPEEPPFPIPPAPEEVNIEKKTLLEDLDFSKIQPEPVKEEPKQEEEPLPIAVHVRLAALDAIWNMLPGENAAEDINAWTFVERTIGILQVVKEAEHAKI